MDGFQRKIIRLLSENSRASVSDIASELGASRKKVKETIDRLVDKKIIKRFTIELAQEAEFTSQPFRALFNIRLVAPNCRQLFADLQKHDEILGAWSISSSDIDMMVLVEAKDVEVVENVRNSVARHPLVQTMYTNSILTTWRDPRSNSRRDGEADV
ncbi:Lrp/AsnC family transcriptional regulator (plasmid) [Leisingera caerulea]|uniref:Lrp/AsnC family transcriptional regulator n=1 Tax=Leisingera caerulea TaxID=506591 RepID=A0A9Q9LYQ2_LEICA|nr:Lrp/AsnC family transcriptional regulator [Leisingera caerulea]UWQ52026.1 Lrp/AsnC family transcriptional regulator [Leisingera caerulea]UWQ56255.1 Lrp/AsnC family transcriptional regulator [Leisingera caerulea]UWQ60757.1 Lrp/AsnC family transcriptional regulator [Leisingera caerulea]UWQ85826.1 Lrp/AsnC family transcriptional regulator [Leisingera caerulea]